MVHTADLEPFLKLLNEEGWLKDSELRRVLTMLSVLTKGLYTEIPEEKILGVFEGLPWVEEVVRGALKEQIFNLSARQQRFWLYDWLEQGGRGNGPEGEE